MKNGNGPVVIASVSYGAFDKFLTTGSYFVWVRALKLACQYENSLVVWGSFTHSFKETEILLKQRSLPDDLKNVYTGFVASTIEEAEKARASFTGEPKEIIVVTGETHARSAVWVWQKIFPGVNVRAVTIPICQEVEEGHPMIFLRSKPAWRFVNWARLKLLHTSFGFKLLRGLRLRQPTSN